VRTYFDASVIVALFMHDTFSERADEFGRSNAVVPVVSDFGAAEFSSAVARRVRTGDISIDRARVILSRFDSWHVEIAGGIEIGPGDISSAATFLRRLDLNLRTPDAIHLAVTQRLGVPLATFDDRMAAAARTLGLSTVQL
jgi:predicted nucleic acid-binding protein